MSARVPLAVMLAETGLHGCANTEVRIIAPWMLASASMTPVAGGNGHAR